ncbi:DNA repair protein RecN [Phaeovibrio sulfidiphilus]|uniref:DNA repair protein RecN n=1 Tax=Phaeovibrio sulfidiphilus TaxID=1220600 RepID=A0A8J7CD01_9PROT|nr:DNA repair protein RecN [Phaeovibrio sulfidiphilus]MBE1236469.1 DNA repair protein RecN [Phaeovibrio sulfidiphilus]
MLSFLSIRNVVLIEKLDLPLEPGLSVLTGETGAGKSILLDSLSLVLGGRSDAGLVRKGADRLSVSAEFSLPEGHRAHAVLEEADLAPAPGEPLIVRRDIGVDGRSKAFVNDRPASVGLLKRLGAELLEIHGQFESHGLLDPSRHGPVLDAFSGAVRSALADTAATWATWQERRKARRECELALEAARRDEAYLRAVLEELEQAAPKPGEEERLAIERARLMSGEKLADAMKTALDALFGPPDVSRALSTASRALERIADADKPGLTPILEGLERAAVELSEARASLEAYASRLDLDPRTLERVEERLFALRGLARKYDRPADTLEAFLEDTRTQLASLDDSGFALDRLQKEETAAREAYLTRATALSKARKSAATALDKAVNAELPPLKLEKARFGTSVEALDEDAWGPRGFDRVTFLVATNPGAALAPIHKIASGGELARFMLALKVVLAADGDVETLVFDEVDAGIGGATADAVGERLARLGKAVQVLVVTHSPQVAARGTHHYHVSKTVRGQDELPGTEVRTLAPDHRLEEVARMLAGAEVTDAARAAARALLGETP